MGRCRTPHGFPGKYWSWATLECERKGSVADCQDRDHKEDTRRTYAAAPTKGKTAILDQVIEVTCWCRDHARQQLAARLKQPPGRAVYHDSIDQRKTRGWKCFYNVRLCHRKLRSALGD